MSKELEANSRKRPHDANEDDRLSEIALKKRKSADAQAAFRKKRANYITTLEQAVTSLESVVLQLQESCRESRAETQYYKLSASRLHWAVFETCGGCYRMLVASGWIQEEFKIIGTPVVHYPLAITYGADGTSYAGSNQSHDDQVSPISHPDPDPTHAYPTQCNCPGCNSHWYLHQGLQQPPTPEAIPYAVPRMHHPGHLASEISSPSQSFNAPRNQETHFSPQTSLCAFSNRNEANIATSGPSAIVPGHRQTSLPGRHSLSHEEVGVHSAPTFCSGGSVNHGSYSSSSYGYTSSESQTRSRSASHQNPLTSSSVAAIKAEAFGAPRRTRKRQGQSPERATKVALDVLQARGIFI